MRRRSIAELSAEVAANPDSTASVELAAAYRERGDLDRALRLCLRGLERHPTLVAAHFELGLIYVARGERQLALDEFGVVKRLTPDHVETRCAIARLYAGEGRQAEATRELEDALRLRPGDPALQALLERVGGAEAAAGDGGRAAVPPQPPAPEPVSPARPAPGAPEPSRAFREIAPGTEWTGGLLADASGEVVLGEVLAGGRDVGQTLAEQLSGAPEEARDVAAYLDLGAWRTLMVESEQVRLTLEHLGRQLLIVATTPETPPGRTLRIREAVRRRARTLLSEKK